MFSGIATFFLVNIQQASKCERLYKEMALMYRHFFLTFPHNCRKLLENMDIRHRYYFPTFPHNCRKLLENMDIRHRYYFPTFPPNCRKLLENMDIRHRYYFLNDYSTGNTLSVNSPNQTLFYRMFRLQ